MTISSGLVRDQVVEVRIPKPGGPGLGSFGSGYLISPTLALTARHIVKGFQSADVVFSARQPARPPTIPADVAWTGEACDIALLQLRWPAGQPEWAVTAAALGDVSSSRSELPFEAIGFPHRKARPLPNGGSLRDCDHVGGLILGERNLKSGMLDLYLTADPVGVGNAWAGFSGAAVFAYGFLVGVAVQAERVTPGFVAHRIAVPAGACESLNPSFVEPDESVARFRELLADDGHDLKFSPARRRPAYSQMIEKLRPSGGLLDRDSELGALRAFARPGGDGQISRPYLDWVAETWAGKTALAAQFASDPPPGTDIIAFFVSRTRAQQAADFWSNACDQLAALINEASPLQPNEATFLKLWAEAGDEAKRNGRTLVLLIDGLDEDDQSPLIARAIPPDGDQTRRIIVFRRDQPELNLPTEHPLSDQRKCDHKTLVKNAHARAREEESLDTLRKFLTGRQADILGVLAAAGPISARDIAAVLCVEDPSLPDSRLLSAREISPQLRHAVSLGLLSPLANAPERFAFQHDMLWQMTVGQLAADDVIAVHQDAIKRWAAGYAERSWPDGTPSYLLVGYPAFLAGLPDTAELAALTTPARITRLRASTGDDAAAVHELTLAIGQLAKAKHTDLPTACRLAFRREHLLDALSRYPVSLIEAHAALGHWERAEQIAEYQAWPVARVGGLTAVGAAAVNAGQTRRADLLFAKALHALTGITDRTLCSDQRKSLTRAAAASTRLIDPRIITEQFPDLQEGATALLDFTAAYASAGLIDYAEQFITEAYSANGPLARAAAAVAAAADAASQPRNESEGYGLPGRPSLTSLAKRQLAIQTHLIINELIATVAELVIRAAAGAGRLDTAVRVAAAPRENYALLSLIGEACQIAAISGRAIQVTEPLADAYTAATELANPVQRAAALTIIAAAATGQLANDVAASARRAAATIADPAGQAQVHSIAAAAITNTNQPVQDLISTAHATAMTITDAALRAATLTAIAQAAATAGQPASGLIAAARAAAVVVPDPGPRALALGTIAQAAAVAAQLVAAQQITASTTDPARLAKAARMTAARHLARARSIINDGTDVSYQADTLARSAQAFAADQLTMIRSIIANITDPAERVRAFGALAQAAEEQPTAADLIAAAREANATISDPRQRAWTLGAMAQGTAASGQLGAARSITADMADAGQRAWTLAAIAQAAVAAGQPADDLIAAARDTAATIADAGQRAWALGVVTEAAAINSQLAVGQSMAAELSDPGQRAWAFGIITRAAATAGQPTDDLIIAAHQAAMTITHPAQRAWALGQVARDAAAISQSGLAAQLVSEAEEAALAEDPILRSGILAAMTQAAGAQLERAAMLDRACRAADVPDLVQRGWALAEISRYAPGRHGCLAHLADQAHQAAELADPVQRSAALTALVRAANRSGDDVLARAITDSIPSPGPQVSALLTLARSAAVRGHYSRAKACGDDARRVAEHSGPTALPWARDAISNTEAFCGSLHDARAGAGFSSGYNPVLKLVRTEPMAVLGADSSEEVAVAEAARSNGMLDRIKTFARSINDPNRRGYLLAAIAEAELAEGNSEDAAETLSKMPSPAGLADRSVRGRLLAVAVAVAAARDAGSACAELAARMADCFSAELIPVIAALDGSAIECLAQELGDLTIPS